MVQVLISVTIDTADQKKTTEVLSTVSRLVSSAVMVAA